MRSALPSGLVGLTRLVRLVPWLAPLGLLGACEDSSSSTGQPSPSPSSTWEPPSSDAAASVPADAEGDAATDASSGGFAAHSQCDTTPTVLSTLKYALYPVARATGQGVLAVWEERAGTAGVSQLVARSFDGAWRAPKTLAENALTEAPRIAAVASGDAWATWKAVKDGMRARYTWSTDTWAASESFPVGSLYLYTALAAGGSVTALAHAGSKSLPVATHDGSGWHDDEIVANEDSEVRVAVSATGDVLVVWQDLGSVETTVKIRRRTGGVWQPALDAAPNTFVVAGDGFQLYQPSFLPNGDAVVMWRVSNGVGTRVHHASDGTFEDEETHYVGPTPGDIDEGGVWTDADGNVTVSYRAGTNVSSRLLVRKRTAGAWSEPRDFGVVNDGSSIAIDGEGNLAVVVAGADVPVTLYESEHGTSAWTAGTIVNADPNLIRSSMAHDAQGRPVIVWTSSQTDGSIRLFGVACRHPS